LSVYIAIRSRSEIGADRRSSAVWRLVMVTSNGGLISAV
jgi:hypothetical protein